MEYIYGALLLHKLGQQVSEENLKKVISSTGTSIDEAKIKVLVASLKDVDISKELESAAMISAAPVQAKEEAPVEKKEEKAAEAAEGLSSLFG